MGINEMLTLVEVCWRARIQDDWLHMNMWHMYNSAENYAAHISLRLSGARGCEFVRGGRDDEVWTCRGDHTEEIAYYELRVIQKKWECMWCKIW